MLRRSFAFLVAGVFALPAAAQRYELATLTITHPWSRTTAPGMPMGVAYLTITNNGKAPDALVAASTTVAARVEFHQTSFADGMARMRPLQEIVVAPGKTVKIEPGGTVELSVEAGDAPSAAEHTQLSK